MSQQVTSHASAQPDCHGVTDTPSTLLPSDLQMPGGSNIDGTSIEARDLLDKVIEVSMPRVATSTSPTVKTVGT